MNSYTGEDGPLVVMVVDTVCFATMNIVQAMLVNHLAQMGWKYARFLILRIITII